LRAIEKVPFDFTALPDWAVLTDQQTTQLLGVSLDTLGRLDRAGDGPPRVKLSPRRHGRPVGGLRKWIQERVSTSSQEPGTTVAEASSSTWTGVCPAAEQLRYGLAEVPDGARFGRDSISGQ
jgi:hypothetical protein